jgi:sulfofructose kinase
MDVLGLGAVAVDDLVYVEEFPQPDSKVIVSGRERQSGGLAGTALVAASRLGCSCAYAGTLGDDELSRFVIEGLKAEGVSAEWIVHRDEARPFHGTIIVDTKAMTRTILVDSRGAIGADSSLPEASLIRSIRVLLVDAHGLPGMLRAARIAREAGIPVVGDFEKPKPPPFEELLSLVDHLIIPRELARELSGKSGESEIVRALLHPSRSVVVVTAGEEGSWYASAETGQSVFHQPAFGIDTVDTTGCGDVFHGAYAAGLVWGTAVSERVRFASAVAALKATSQGGQKGIPTREQTQEFLQRRSSEAIEL